MATGLTDAAKRLLVCGCLVPLALLLGGCSGHRVRARPPAPGPRTIDVYASLPMHGARGLQGDAVLNGIRLALSEAHYRAGQWRIRLRVRSDSSPGGGAWGVDLTARNARAAATDPEAVFYIGELDSGASEVSGPILNEAGVPQVSPLSTYPGLASGSRGRAPPVNPTGKPTFVRLAPPDTIQAQALLQEAAHADCPRVAVVHDASLDGTGLAAALEARRGQYGVALPSEVSLTSVARNISAYAGALKSQSVRCLIYAGLSSPDAVSLMAGLAGATPRPVRLIGSDGVCTASFTDPRLGGLPAGAAPPFRCTSPAGNMAASQAGVAFVHAYAVAYPGLARDPLAVFGYEAMQVGIATIVELGSHGDDREAVSSALFAVRDRPSAIGTYSIERSGNTTLSGYGLYKVGAGGAPVYCRCP